MGLSVEPRNPMTDPTSLNEGETAQAHFVFQELERILESRFFKNAVRSRQFLHFVVTHKLDGHADQLKERTIGTELFRRSPGYATGDDPVVRVQAGEVRRRLEQFYQTDPNHTRVRIELPVGSYSPHFVWTTNEVKSLHGETSGGKAAPAQNQVRLPMARVVTLLLAVMVCGGLIYFGFISRSSSSKQQSRIEQFWAPAFATPQPVLICLAKPVLYRPTLGLYRKYSDKHPGTFQTEVERSNQVLPLLPADSLKWSDVAPLSDYGVAVGDVQAAVQISGLLGKVGKPSQVRIGANYSFEDLRNSPSVVIGAFNNRWTIQQSSNLHFAFIEDNGNYSIREQSPNGRVWEAQFPGASQQTGEDFAVVARLLDSKTGQFTIVAAGLTGSGTQAAGEFVANPNFLERGLSGVPSDWQKKNMELILQTHVTDFVPGPPSVIAAYYW